MKRILINATQPEELRLAIVDGQRLLDLDIESQAREQRKGNVYKARITRIEPSLEACFVDYGEDRQGFLSLREISPEYFNKEPSGDKFNIKEVLKEGQEIIVQVDKEERGTKGAALTTFISLAGRYLVLMPNSPKAGGVSRRIDGDDRSDLREAMASLELPAGMGVIARTAGVGRTAEELQWDLNYLLDLWQALLGATYDRKAPFLIYQESNIIIRALRDYLKTDIGEIIVDAEEIYAHASEFMRVVMPGQQNKLKLYSDSTPLFSRYQIESQIESAHRREVRLPSGGSIVIDNTEALTAIDINSARATGGTSIEETALNTNLEAADEIARQLRLRDLGGLVVIDFIDMNASKNQREVENRLRDACEMDRARIQLGRISRFGLLEMSRQRLRPSLREHTHLVCPRCDGQSTIRTIESTALQVLRLMEEEALKEKTGRVIAQLPASVATYLLNEKRNTLTAIEKRTEAQLTLVANPHLDSPKFELLRIREDQMDEADNNKVSHALIGAAPAVSADPGRNEANGGPRRAAQVPVVTGVLPSTPAPTPSTPEPAAEPLKAADAGGLIRLWQALMRMLGLGPKPVEDKQDSNAGKRRQRGGRSQQDRGGRRSNVRTARRGGRRDGEIVTNRDRRGDKDESNDKNADKGGRKGRGSKAEGGQKRQQREAKAANSPKDNSEAKDNNREANKEGAPKPAANEAQGDNASAEGQGRSRRRGRRGGRRRRGGAEGGNAAADGAQENQAQEGQGQDKQSQEGQGQSHAQQDKAAQQGENSAADARPAAKEAGAEGEEARPRRRRRSRRDEGGNEGQSNQPADAPAAAADSAPPKSSAPSSEQSAQAPAQASKPQAESPKADAPKAETPKADTAKADAVKSEAPKVEAPKAEAPKAEAPKAAAEKPATAAPAEKPPEPKPAAPKPVESKPAEKAAEAPKPAPAAQAAPKPAAEAPAKPALVMVETRPKAPADTAPASAPTSEQGPK
ncbi:MAG: Rne/Rng family ribonuclease [Oceanococcaceae bacterium]